MVELSSITHRLTRTRACFIAASLIANLSGASLAHTQSASDSAEPAPAPVVFQEDDDAVLDPAEPDFVVVSLPTTLRLPKFRGNFRLTRRFAGNLHGKYDANPSGCYFNIHTAANPGGVARGQLTRTQ